MVWLKVLGKIREWFKNPKKDSINDRFDGNEVFRILDKGLEDKTIHTVKVEKIDAEFWMLAMFSSSSPYQVHTYPAKDMCRIIILLFNCSIEFLFIGKIEHYISVSVSNRGALDTITPKTPVYETLKFSIYNDMIDEMRQLLFNIEDYYKTSFDSYVWDAFETWVAACENKKG